MIESGGPVLRSVAFEGALLERGFWLYVWEITAADGRVLHYVGRTGDSSSANAQSPFSRLSQHLGTNGRANALRRHLKDAGIEAPETCQRFSLFPYGPIFPEGRGSTTEHNESRDVVAALEKALADAMVAAGYEVLNKISCRRPLDETLFARIRSEFAVHFPKLRR